jgi:hypothetical protein
MEGYGYGFASMLNDWFNYHNVYSRFSKRTTSQRKRRAVKRK